MTIKQAMLANFLSACSSFLGLVIGILIGQQTAEGNQWIFAVMGGMFLYIALVDMVSVSVSCLYFRYNLAFCATVWKTFKIAIAPTPVCISAPNIVLLIRLATQIRTQIVVW